MDKKEYYDNKISKIIKNNQEKEFNELNKNELNSKILNEVKQFIKEDKVLNIKPYLDTIKDLEIYISYPSYPKSKIKKNSNKDDMIHGLLKNANYISFSCINLALSGLCSQSEILLRSLLENIGRLYKCIKEDDYDLKYLYFYCTYLEERRDESFKRIEQEYIEQEKIYIKRKKEYEKNKEINKKIEERHKKIEEKYKIGKEQYKIGKENYKNANEEYKIGKEQYKNNREAYKKLEEKYKNAKEEDEKLEEVYKKLEEKCKAIKKDYESDKKIYEIIKILYTEQEKIYIKRKKEYEKNKEIKKNLENIEVIKNFKNKNEKYKNSKNNTKEIKKALKKLNKKYFNLNFNSHYDILSKSTHVNFNCVLNFFNSNENYNSKGFKHGFQINEIKQTLYFIIYYSVICNSEYRKFFNNENEKFKK